ncbi:hypothetical protein BHE74_00046233 [Ensete ventricosum]|nr:hypothetical protein BHE74_00046233 [Ensete ventricosum]
MASWVPLSLSHSHRASPYAPHPTTTTIAVTYAALLRAASALGRQPRLTWPLGLQAHPWALCPQATAAAGGHHAAGHRSCDRCAVGG